MIFLAKFIPEEKIREIRNSADIVEIVSEAVLLKKTGRDFVGLCPFHSEKTPSFTVSPDKQVFYCFGCSEAGDVVSFIMKHEGFTYPEAVKKLAARYGIDIPTGPLSPEQKRRMTEREDLLRVNREAADFYCRCLQKSGPGRRAMDYLNGRGMSVDIIKGYGLGYAPEGWDALTRFFQRRKVPNRVAEKAGLVVPRKSGRGHYDRFRDRIIFPIADPSRAVIGLGGRVLDDTLPKYLNSPETPVYNKSRSLYGIDRARQACRSAGTVHIVEGYFDLLALHQHGFVNTVATLGTSLTSDHVRILKSLIGGSGKAILVFDSDAAGIKAAKRSIEVFDRGHVDAHILVLPAGHDPDSFLVKFGAEALGRSVAGARGIIPFLLKSAISEHGVSIQGKVRILSELSAPLAAVGDGVARSLYIREIAEQLDIDEKAVLGKVRDKSGAEKNLGPAVGTEQNRVERQLVSMMFQFPEALAEIEQLDALDFFEDETLKTIGREILSRKGGAGRDVSEIISTLADRGHGGIASLLALGDQAWSPGKCITTVRRFVENRRKQRDSHLIDQQIKDAEKSKDQELLVQLLDKKQQMAVMSEKRKMSLLKR